MACSWVISHTIPSYLLQGENSTSLNNNLMVIGYRTIIWPGLANILDVIYAIGMGIGLSVHSFGCSPVYLSTHHTFIMSTHFQTNSPGDLSETCWIHSSCYTADLVDFWSTHYGSIQTWSTFGHASRNSRRFAASYVLAVSMHLQTNYWWNLAHVQRPNTFWSAPGLINFWSYSTEFRPFPGLWFIEQFVHITRLLIGFSLNLLCKLHVDLLWLD